MTYILLGDSARIALPVMQAIRAAGPEAMLLVGGADAARLRWSSLCRAFVAADLADDDAVLRSLERVAGEQPGARLIPYDCEAVRVAARLRHRVALDAVPVPDTATLDMFDDKWRFHAFCTRHGLPVPATRFVGPKRNLDFAGLAREVGVPFVVKPTNCSGSAGVEVIGSAAELDARIVRNPLYRHEPLIAQRFVDGQDIDINLLAREGRLAACSVQCVHGPWLEFGNHPQLVAIAETLCAASGYHGVMNVDLRLQRGSNDVFLLESNPRFWASIAAGVGCGLNFVTESARRSWPSSTVLLLTAGRYNTRHPLLQPAAWTQLALDRGEAGRLLRARLFDPYLLACFAAGLPGMATRWLRRRRDSLLDRPPQTA